MAVTPAGRQVWFHTANVQKMIKTTVVEDLFVAARTGPNFMLAVRAFRREVIAVYHRLFVSNTLTSIFKNSVVHR